LTFAATRDGYYILNYKHIQDLMTSLTPLKLMGDKNKKTVYNFVCKLVSKIDGTHSIYKWLSKRKGENFFDMITTSDIAYTVAVVENSYDYWDQCFALKNMTNIARETYLESEGYMEKKPKFT
jgi:hypothetical protein